VNLDDLPSEMFKRWVYSSENKGNNEGIITYIAEGSAHAAARGKIGFEIKKGGEFIIHDVSPTDRPRKIIGHYEIIRPSTVKVYLDDQRQQSFSLNIISLQQDILRVTKS
jgi:hypothetical protein